MDKGTVNLRAAISNRDEAEAIEREIEGIRRNLDDLVNELDHRRHQLNPVVIVRHHPVLVAAAGLVLLSTVAGSIALFRARRREAMGWGARGKRMGRAIARLARDPEGAIPEAPSIARRVLAAGAGAAAALVVGRMVRRLVRRTP